MTDQNSLENIPDIQTLRLHLRILGVNDAGSFQRLTDHPQITNIVHFLPTPFTEIDAKNLIIGKADGRDKFMGVWLHGFDDMAAVIGVHLHDENEIEIGYWVRPDQQRKGIAREGATALIMLLTKFFPKREIIAECRPENRPSWQLLEKIGFQATGKPGLRPGRYRFIWNKDLLV
ncbi:GNAT family N-acetyltransferase [Gluconobacter sp. P5B12]|uniref:GNAT family N-acetyltransferase n=1 Tax=unclassified Gluconobacter TaxID=2644261 RepID=UPI001C0520FC|nr:GNAT family N-acetyltransferase [Gluconobacter sp. P5B12]